MWAGLGIAYAASSIPPSFAILAVSAAAYVATLGGTALTRRRAAPVTAASAGVLASPK
jgi:hypothetical protein